jgi:hypothetical protein
MLRKNKYKSFYQRARARLFKTNEFIEYSTELENSPIKNFEIARANVKNKYKI